MDRILFIVPPNISYEAYTRPGSNVKVVQSQSRALGTVVTDMPLGPMSLSAYIKAHVPAETRLIDFNVVLNQLPGFEYASFRDLFRDYLSRPEWRDFAPTVVGVSALFSPAYRNMLDLASVAREVFPQSFVIGGGFLPTNLYKQIYRDSPHFDALCFAEGEKPLVRLLQAADRRKAAEEDPCWITADKAAAAGPAEIKGIVKIGQNGLKQQALEPDFIDNLDEIPFLDYDFLDIKGYAINPTMAAYPAIGKTAQNFHVMTSRGCVFRCAFCAQDTVHGRTMRYYSLDRIREDFRRLRDEYGVQTIIIEDDHFMGDPDRAYQILGVLIEFGLTAFFPNSLALYALKRPMLERLKAVGVDQLVLAVESGSAEVLHEVMHKPLKLEIIARVTKDCREIGIYTDCNLVLGLPGETKRHFEDARRFLKTTYANWFRINIATPIVGSEMLEICLENDYLTGDYNECDYKKAIVETPEFTAADVQEFAYLMNLELNFVYNSDFRLAEQKTAAGDHAGARHDYETALMGFLNAVKAKPNHPFGHHYAALTYDRLGDSASAEHHRELAISAAREDAWQKWLRKFPEVRIGEGLLEAVGA